MVGGYTIRYSDLLNTYRRQDYTIKTGHSNVGENGNVRWKYWSCEGDDAKEIT